MGEIGEMGEIEEILVKCASSIKTHIQVFHPDRFNRPFSSRHEELFEAIDDTSIQKLLVLAHRGFGKTSIFNFGLPSQNIIFRKTSFLVPVSSTAAHAVMQSENLKRDLQLNPAIKSLLGDIKSDTFSKELWIARHPDDGSEGRGIMVLPRGCEQQVRGILHGNDRPGLVIVDDLENSEAVLSEDQRTKVKDWFISDLLGAFDHSSDKWRLIVVGTILHQSALLQDLRRDPEWKVLEFPLCDEEYRSHWKAFMDDEAIRKLKRQSDTQGKLDVFYREYMNDPTHKEQAAFKREYFKEYVDAELEVELENIVIGDPTRSRGETASYSAIVGLGLNLNTNAVYVRDTYNERVTNEDFYQALIDMAVRIGAHVIGIEVTGLKEYITKPFMDYMFAQGYNFELIELNPRRAPGLTKGGRDKEGRIRQLSAYYRMGYIYHNKGACEELERQLLAFPHSDYLDLPDALSYFIQMTEKGERYFAMALGAGENEDDALARLMEADEDYDPDEEDYDLDEEEFYATFDY